MIVPLVLDEHVLKFDVDAQTKSVYYHTEKGIKQISIESVSVFLQCLFIKSE